MFIYPLSSLPKDRYGQAGGKAASLANMMQHTKLCIPQGFVLLSGGLDADGKLKREAREELTGLLQRLDPSVTYAVRSSAVNEDGEAASFAGQYETITDVEISDIPKAVEKVAASAHNANVQAYTSDHADASNATEDGIGIVIQRFVKAEFAGVLFTADPVTGRDESMVGNYVRGEGEKLVSGDENAEVFSMGAIRYTYEGPAEFAPYAKKLCRYGKAIRALYDMPMDIEWAVSGPKVYILQARPITTLRRLSMDTYDINGTKSACKLLTRTNVGEIFMQPVSPMTFSVLEKINEILGLPEWLDNICGQPYMNISVMCSLAVAFGKKKEKAFESMKGLVGRVPEGIDVPISPFDKRAFLKRVYTLFFPKERSKLSRQQKKEMVRDLADIARDMIDQIRRIEDADALCRYWSEAMAPKLRDGMASVIGQSGTSMLPLFNTRANIAKVAGEEMAERLCGGCLGLMESMKPLLLIADVVEGRITKEEYIKSCGQRCINEMELMAVHPYEDEAYVDRLIEEHRNDKPDLYAMQEAQKKGFEEALSQFKTEYPGRRKWIDKKIASFVQANTFREELRSKGVWIFCVFREYLLRAGTLTGLGEDIFMLTFDEVFALLGCDAKAGEHAAKRRETYERYLTYEPFPNIVMGRFDPEAWMADPKRRSDLYIQNYAPGEEADADIRGFAGAAGVIRGKVRVIRDIAQIGEVKEGDILVTGATNIGWTPVFTKVAAIVTDIGAPLSHAAIVARECGIPAVVGCGNATTLLHTGDEVIVDGSAGTVKLTQIKEDEA